MIWTSFSYNTPLYANVSKYFQGKLFLLFLEVLEQWHNKPKNKQTNKQTNKHTKHNQN